MAKLCGIPDSWLSTITVTFAFALKSKSLRSHWMFLPTSVTAVTGVVGEGGVLADPDPVGEVSGGGNPVSFADAHAVPAATSEDKRTSTIHLRCMELLLRQ